MGPIYIYEPYVCTNNASQIESESKSDLKRTSTQQPGSEEHISTIALLWVGPVRRNWGYMAEVRYELMALMRRCMHTCMHGSGELPMMKIMDSGVLRRYCVYA